MKTDGSLELSSVVNGGAPNVLGTTNVGAFTPGAFANIGVNTNNGLISVRIDGILVLQVKNEDHDDGKAGFTAIGVGAFAEIDDVLVRSATEEQVALTTINIEVDGKPLNTANLSPTNYTMFNGIYDYENYETYYPVPLTQKTAPVVTASCDDKDVKISVSQADGAPGVAIVRFNKGGAFKTYMITFSPGAVITPEKNGKAYADSAKAPGDVVELGKLKDMVSSDKWAGDWDMWINVATNPSLTSANFTANTQAGLVICDGTNPTQNYIRVNTRYNTATQVGAGAGWVVNGGAPGSATSAFPASHKLYYLRIVKKGNTLQAFGFTSNSTSTNFVNIGAAQTFTPEFFENAKLQAYATNASANDITSTIAVVPDILGVHSTAFSTYELFTEDQIAVDAAAIVVGDGIAYRDTDSGANAAEKATNAIRAKLAAAGTVTVKKATDSQVKKMNYDTNLSTFVFDTRAVTAEPGKENTGSYTLTVKAGGANAVIGSYNVVNVTGKGFDKLTDLIGDAKGTPKVPYTPSSWFRLQEALAQAVSLNVNDEAIAIAGACDKLDTALNKLRFSENIQVVLSHDSLEAIAGQNLVADVFVPVSNSSSVYAIAALYDAEGRMAAYEAITRDTTAPPVRFSVSLPIPEDTVGLTYKFFLWNADTMTPLIDSTSLVSDVWKVRNSNVVN
jgi:hypothetical protein